MCKLLLDKLVDGGQIYIYIHIHIHIITIITHHMYIYIYLYISYIDDSHGKPTEHQIHSWIWFVLGATSPMVPLWKLRENGWSVGQIWGSFMICLLLLSREWMGCWGLLGWLLLVMTGIIPENSLRLAPASLSLSHLYTSALDCLLDRLVDCLDMFEFQVSNMRVPIRPPID